MILWKLVKLVVKTMLSDYFICIELSYDEMY